MNKRGQFYLVAAIIIVLAISGISSVSTYAIVKPEPRTIHDLSSDLRTESARIIDYGVKNDKEIKQLIEKFADDDFGPYFLKKTDNANVVLIYGNKVELYNLKYTQEVVGEISIGGVGWTITDDDVVEIRTVNIVGDKTTVEVLDKTYEFKLRDNEMFYFVMVKEEDGEVYIEQNE